MLWSLPVWAIVINNFSFHYAFYVVMNWLPTYFNSGGGRGCGCPLFCLPASNSCSRGSGGGGGGGGSGGS
jgi:hypothetical protein